MTVWFGLFRLNQNLPPPPTPKDQLAQINGFGALLRAQMKAGLIKEVHSFVEGGGGYFITGDVSDEQQFQALAMWAPFVTFELHKTLPGEKSVELFAAAIAQRAQLS